MEGISSGVSRFNATFRVMQRFCRATRRRAGGLVCLEGGREEVKELEG